MNISIPNDWRPRPWQLPVFEARERGINYGAIVVHRRAGKTDGMMNVTAVEMCKQPGNYAHVFPTAEQARKAAWRAIDKEGRRMIDRVFPPEIRKSTRENEMQIELANGATWQLLTSDNPSALVGTNYRGVVLDEYSIFPDSECLDYLRPVLAENGGWMYAIGTFRGRNHFYDLYHLNKDNPEWYTAHLDVTQTKEWDGTPLVPHERIEADRKSGMGEGWLRQEYYLDTTAAYGGAYYAAQVREMRQQGRIGDFPHDVTLPVYVAFDLGYSDATVATFFQALEPKKTVIIGSQWWQFTAAPEIAREILETYPWGRTIDTVILPFDGRRAGPAGDSWAGVFEALKLGRQIEVLRKAQDSKHLEIALVQQSLATTYVDERPRPWTKGKPNNAKLLDALAGYRTERIANRPGAYSRNPTHTWESHGADSVRYLMVYRHGDIGLGGWGKAPDWRAQDRGLVRAYTQ